MKSSQPFHAGCIIIYLLRCYVCANWMTTNWRPFRKWKKGEGTDVYWRWVLQHGRLIAFWMMMSNWPMFIRGVGQQTEKADKNADGMVNGVHGSFGKSSGLTLFLKAISRQAIKHAGPMVLWFLVFDFAILLGTYLDWRHQPDAFRNAPSLASGSKVARPMRSCWRPTIYKSSSPARVTCFVCILLGWQMWPGAGYLSRNPDAARNLDIHRNRFCWNSWNWMKLRSSEQQLIFWVRSIDDRVLTASPRGHRGGRDWWLWWFSHSKDVPAQWKIVALALRIFGSEGQVSV